MSLPGYGIRPYVTSSYSKIPNDHTSDLTLNFRSKAASGAVHLIGNFVAERPHLRNFFKKEWNPRDFRQKKLVDFEPLHGLRIIFAFHE